MSKSLFSETLLPALAFPIASTLSLLRWLRNSLVSTMSF